MSDQMYVPPAVQEELDEIVHATGGRGEIERRADRRYRIIVSNDRCRVTVDLKMTGPGRWGWGGSTLTVDGQQHPLVPGTHELGRLFRDPDGYDAAEAPPEGELDAMPPAREPGEAPVIVAQQFRTLHDRLGEGAEVTLGAEGDVWVIGVDGPRGGIRLRYREQRRDRWGMDQQRPLQIVVDGLDRTAEAKGDLAKALALMGEQRGDSATNPPPVDRPSSASRSNAVETRRSTVIRV
ncbi:hypothetical protein [Micromonospora chalcea]|uniref:hypothetical protein n=1 Tax=Micromonospora chalcea TaxID=1874 RepID=UPI003D71C9DB